MSARIIIPNLLTRQRYKLQKLLYLDFFPSSNQRKLRKINLRVPRFFIFSKETFSFFFFFKPPNHLISIIRIKPKAENVPQLGFIGRIRSSGAAAPAKDEERKSENKDATLPYCK